MIKRIPVLQILTQWHSLLKLSHSFSISDLTFTQFEISWFVFVMCIAYILIKYNSAFVWWNIRHDTSPNGPVFSYYGKPSLSALLGKKSFPSYHNVTQSSNTQLRGIMFTYIDDVTNLNSTQWCSLIKTKPCPHSMRKLKALYGFRK